MGKTKIDVPCVPGDYIEFSVKTIKYMARVETVQLSRFPFQDETRSFVTLTGYADGDGIKRLDGKEDCNNNCDKCKFSKNGSCQYEDFFMNHIAGLIGIDVDGYSDIFSIEIPFDSIGWGKPLKVK